ncbi:GNAT family N-acetyltransferase [Streptomyces sp. NPDC101150]|uniref:GNAT family N-acetyltransferase n=1 Tax=Streptomyces sp. NPDC101150 TaxID=3366114 RepID=UPI0037F898A1
MRRLLRGRRRCGHRRWTCQPQRRGRRVCRGGSGELASVRDESAFLREGTWGNGYATEAVKQAVAYAFTHAGSTRLSAKHHPDNPASGRVLIKAGFVQTGTVPTGPALGRPGVHFPVYEIRWRDNQT